MNVLNIFIVTLCLMLNPSIEETTIPAEVGTTTTGIGFGRTKKNCEGKGFCVVEVVASPGKISDRYSFATLSYTDEGRVTSFHFSFDNLTERALKEFFSGDHFIMEESFRGYLETKMGRLKINLPSGKYPLQKEKDGFLILCSK